MKSDQIPVTLTNHEVTMLIKLLEKQKYDHGLARKLHEARNDWAKFTFWELITHDIKHGQYDMVIRRVRGLFK